MSPTLDIPVVSAHSIYARLGGAPAIRGLVDRFYALMDELPEAYTADHMLNTGAAAGCRP